MPTSLFTPRNTMLPEPHRLSSTLTAMLLLGGIGFGQGSDSCGSAQPISGEGLFPFDNSTATTDGAPDLLCNAFGTTQITNDVWFAWTSTFDGPAQVSTCGGTGMDSKIAVYAGTSCPTGAAIACNDDSCNLQSTANFDASNGATYLLRIGNYPSASGGSGTFEVSEGGGGGGGCANPAMGPDVIVGDLTGISRYGSVGGVAGYSIGTTSCNIGDAPLSWVASTNQHPVIGQNIYRVEDGRIEQIGQSWLKHGFLALTGNVCCTCINPGTGSLLGVGCSDPYGSGLNGNQQGLGPRSEVNPFTGNFSYPFGSQGQTGDAKYKRIQVANDDLDPALHPTATYYGSGQYVTPDDAAAGNHANNVSFRPVNVGGFSNGSYQLSFTSTTRREEAAIYAWQDVYPAVQLETVSALGDGQFIVGSHAVDLGGGDWRYEYAVYNQISDRCAGSFSVPVPAGITPRDLYFHDVDSHSGEPFDTADWTATSAGGSITWSTTPFLTDPNANAIRWGTLYSFGFTADAAPHTVSASLGLFKPGTGSTLLPLVQAPMDAGGCAGSISSYCVTSPNSAGPGATMFGTGSTSIAANDLQVAASGATPGQFAIFATGISNTSTGSWGNGTSCIFPGTGVILLNRPLRIDSQGEVSFPVDLTGPPFAGVINTVSTWYFQLVYRDPAAGGAFFNTSDGLEVQFCP